MSFNFEEYQKDANTFLNRITEVMETDNKETAGRIFRSVLHAIRDRMPAGEAVQLAANLPIVWKGIYFEGYKLRPEPNVIRNPDQWLEFIRSKDFGSANVDFPTPEDARRGFQAAMMALKEVIEPSEYRQVEQALNTEIIELIEH